MIDGVTIIGKLPPPVGGVTIHTMRLIGLLKKAQCRVRVVDIRCKKEIILNIMYLKDLYKCKKHIIHYQLNNWIELLFLKSLIRSPLVTTVHSFRWEDFSFFRKTCFKILVSSNSIAAFIAPSNAIRKLLIEKGVRESDIYIIPTYLPPVYEEIHQAVPEDILKFVEQNKEKKRCILASASNIVVINKTDIYGLDMCLSVCERNENLSFVFCASKGDAQYIEKIRKKIQRNNLSKRFFLYIGEVCLPSLYRYFDLFVRPTSTDSYGISVEEALQAGISAIASDVCERAEGTCLFKAGNLNDFESKILETLNNQKETLQIKDEENYLNAYMSLYNNLL